MRRRLVRFLCEDLGFRLIAAEFDLGEGEETAGWLANPADARDLRTVSPGAADWGMASTAHWLRSWGTPRGIRFAGLDAPNGGAAIAATLAWVADALRALDPDAAPVLERIEAIVGDLSGTSVAASAQAWAALGVAQQDALTAGLARLHQRVGFLDALLAERGGRDRVVGLRRRLAALQCADYALRANEAMQRGAEAQLDTSARDRFMADSLLALLESEPEVRVVLLAHNGHVQKQPVVWGDYLSAHPLGMYLDRTLGEAYRVIGTTTTGPVSSEMGSTRASRWASVWSRHRSSRHSRAASRPRSSLPVSATGPRWHPCGARQLQGSRSSASAPRVAISAVTWLLPMMRSFRCRA